MKAEHKERLQQDLIKYSKQIGILPKERPKLVLNRKDYHALKVANGMSKWTGGYGECAWGLRTIFVDCSKRSYQREGYRKSVPTGLKRQPKPHLINNANKNYFYIRSRNSTVVHIYKEVKATYRDKLHVLVHELTHYRFRYLCHDANFEERIKEILKGKTFPVEQLYP